MRVGNRDDVLLLAHLAALAAPPHPRGDAARGIAQRLVDEVGPRAYPSPGAAAAQGWVARELRERGWPAESLGAGVVACRPGTESERVLLFLAHTDAVHPSVPGANDNAAAVAILLEAATTLATADTPRRVCLGFPQGEEVGLLGSSALAAAPATWGGPLDLVVSLDVAGHGTPTWNGLGPALGAARLAALLRDAPAHVPFVYRALSQGWPQLERSDHAPFAAAGVPAVHWMARGEAGVYWAYHTPADTVDQLQPATLAAGIRMVEGLAHAPVLPVETAPGPAFVWPLTGWVAPGWMVWVLGALCTGLALFGAGGPPDPEARPVRGAALGRAVAAAAAAGLALFVAGGATPWGAARAGPVLAAGWTAWAAVVAAWSWPVCAREARQVGVAAALAAAAVVGLAGLPLLALPMVVVAAGAGATRWRALRGVAGGIALVPAVYLVRPDAIRELAFHALVPASAGVWAVLLGLLGAPALAAVHARRPRLAIVAGALCVLSIAAAWWTPPHQPPFVERLEQSPWAAQPPDGQ